jgi:hypothetical protein
MNIIERIQEKTPKKNKLGLKIASVLGAVSLAVAESGLVDRRPVLKIALEVLSVKLGAVAVYNAQKVEDGSIDVK